VSERVARGSPAGHGRISCEKRTNASWVGSCSCSSASLIASWRTTASSFSSKAGLRRMSATSASTSGSESRIVSMRTLTRPASLSMRTLAVSRSLASSICA
jgi:hypothetical protein